MASPKSLVPGLVLDTLCALLRDLGRLENRAQIQVERDVQYVLKRFEFEGLPFLTVTLPSLGRALDAALATGGVFTPPPGIRTVRGCVPAFMQDVWEEVFGSDGLMCDDPSPAAIRTLRQVVYLAYKLELGIDPKVVSRRIQEFLDLDATLPGPDDVVTLSRTTERTVECARILIARVLDSSGERYPGGEPLSPTGGPFDPTDIVPRHGPGAVADKIDLHTKFVWRTFYERLDQEYPYSDYFFFSYRHLVDRLARLFCLNGKQVGFAKLTAVPKDSRGPRLISMEPLEYQWIQQGLGRALTWFLEAHPYTKGYVNFTDQSINGDLALYASLTGEFDTLDMKDASDRVSLWLVRQLFSPRLLRKLEACRSAGTRVGRVPYKLRKFAPMGSALCFPVESLVFWALAVARLNLDHSCMVRGRFAPPNRVWVFGDDLVVPHGAYDVLAPTFEELGLLFNSSKCCTGRYFRESCGVDAFRGVNVTPTRLKHVGCSPNDLVSVCAYASAFSQKGCTATGELLYSWVERALNSRLPFSSAPAAQLHRWHPNGMIAQQRNLERCKTRYNRNLQRLEYEHWAPSPIAFEAGRDGWEEFWRCFPDPERDRLDRYIGDEYPLWTASLRNWSRDSVADRLAPWELPSPSPTPGVYVHPRIVEMTRRWSSLHDC